MKHNTSKDLDLSFDINPITGDISKKRGMDAIRQSLKNIVLYNKFEKHFMDHFDVGVRKLLFENKQKGFERFLQSRIKTLLTAYEPRVHVHNVVVHPGRSQNDIVITVNYVAKELQTKDSLELKLGKYR